MAAKFAVFSTMKCPILLLRMLEIRRWKKSVIFRPANRNEPGGAAFCQKDCWGLDKNIKNTHNQKQTTININNNKQKYTKTNTHQQKNKDNTGKPRNKQTWMGGRETL